MSLADWINLPILSTEPYCPFNMKALDDRSLLELLGLYLTWLDDKQVCVSKIRRWEGLSAADKVPRAASPVWNLPKIASTEISRYRFRGFERLVVNYECITSLKHELKSLLQVFNIVTNGRNRGFANRNDILGIIVMYVVNSETLILLNNSKPSSHNSPLLMSIIEVMITIRLSWFSQ